MTLWLILLTWALVVDIGFTAWAIMHHDKQIQVIIKAIDELAKDKEWME